jgi:hypothetical protein
MNAMPQERPWTSIDEENAILEVSEDRRLRRLGIDPDQPQLFIWLELRKRAKEIEERRARMRQASSS